MPRPLNIAKRKKDIARAAIAVLAEGGPSGLTIRAVADKLGGSVTMVTHIYPTRAELMLGTVEQLVSNDQDRVDKVSASNPAEGLRKLLLSMVPIDEERRRRERGRVALISDRDQVSARIFADKMENYARTRLANAFSHLVEPEDLNRAIDFGRTFVNGLTLSITEHPDYWTVDRIESQVENAVDVLISFIQK